MRIFFGLICGLLVAVAACSDSSSSSSSAAETAVASDAAATTGAGTAAGAAATDGSVATPPALVEVAEAPLPETAPESVTVPAASGQLGASGSVAQ